MFDLPLVVFVPRDAPRAKIDAIARSGAELRPCADYDEAEREAKSFARNGGGVYVSPYSHPDVIAGAGTLGLELGAQEPHLDPLRGPDRRRRADQRDRDRAEGAVAEDPRHRR